MIIIIIVIIITIKLLYNYYYYFFCDWTFMLKQMKILNCLIRMIKIKV